MNSEKGLLYNFTGNGKGKTSAALGIALRALGWNWKIAVLQFLKSDMETGEQRFFRKYFPDVIFEDLGLGLTNIPGDHSGYASRGWEKAREMLQHFDGELLILDELNVALALGYLDPQEVVQALRNRQENLNVVITGRNSPPELLAISDLISDISEIKHPFQRGVMACEGLDF